MNQSSDHAGAAQARPRLLVLDDEPEVGVLMRRMGEQAGYETTWVDTAKAFDLARSTHAPDVLAVDIVLPEVDGIEVVNTLAREHCSTPLILFSGYPDYLPVAVRLARARSLNLVAEFLKPYEPTRFVEVLQRVRPDRRPRA